MPTVTMQTCWFCIICILRCLPSAAAFNNWLQLKLVGISTGNANIIQLSQYVLREHGDCEDISLQAKKYWQCSSNKVRWPQLSPPNSMAVHPLDVELSCGFTFPKSFQLNLQYHRNRGAQSNIPLQMWKEREVCIMRIYNTQYFMFWPP